MPESPVLRARSVFDVPGMAPFTPAEVDKLSTALFELFRRTTDWLRVVKVIDGFVVESLASAADATHSGAISSVRWHNDLGTRVRETVAACVDYARDVPPYYMKPEEPPPAAASRSRPSVSAITAPPRRRPESLHGHSDGGAGAASGSVLPSAVADRRRTATAIADEPLSGLAASGLLLAELASQLLPAHSSPRRVRTSLLHVLAPSLPATHVRERLRQLARTSSPSNGAMQRACAGTAGRPATLPVDGRSGRWRASTMGCVVASSLLFDNHVILENMEGLQLPPPATTIPERSSFVAAPHSETSCNTSATASTSSCIDSLLVASAPGFDKPEADLSKDPDLRIGTPSESSAFCLAAAEPPRASQAGLPLDRRRASTSSVRKPRPVQPLNVPADAFDVLSSQFERRIMLGLHSITHGVCAEDRLDDEVTFSRLRALQWLSPDDLHVPPGVGALVLRLAVHELRCMVAAVVPEDKLTSLVAACNVLVRALVLEMRRRAVSADAEATAGGGGTSGSGASAAAAGADELVPAIIFAVLQANPPRLASTIAYLERYRDPAQLMGQVRRDRTWSCGASRSPHMHASSKNPVNLRRRASASLPSAVLSAICGSWDQGMSRTFHVRCLRPAALPLLQAA